jgi:hypothetical protein
MPMTKEEPVPGIPGAFIRRVSALPEALADGEAAGFATEAKPGELLFAVRGTGRFRATGGTLIEFVPESDADEGKLRLFLQGTARGALIHQRGELPLHAATLVPPGHDGAVAICGPSGAGKSTLAAELSRRGWMLIADDTTRITWTDGSPIAWPSRDSIKLWRDACMAADIDIAPLERVASDLDKYYVRVPARETPMKLSAVAELVPGPAGIITSAADKMALVTRNTYRPGHIRPLGMQQDHVQIAARVASACAMFRLPGGRTATAGELADMVEGHVRS